MPLVPDRELKKFTSTDNLPVSIRMNSVVFATPVQAPLGAPASTKVNLNSGATLYLLISYDDFMKLLC